MRSSDDICFVFIVFIVSTQESCKVLEEMYTIASPEPSPLIDTHMPITPNAE
jgi:hypothetical protein